MRLCLLLLVGSVCCGQEVSKTPVAKKLSAGQLALERLKALEGDWKSLAEEEHAVSEVAVSYKLLGGGSTVVETLFPGSDHEMISMYHMDGSQLVVTHYCALGNQPRMRGEPDKKNKNKLHLRFDGGTNFDPKKDAHIHEAVFEFISKDRVRSEWVLFDDGKRDHSKKFDLVRIKKKKQTKTAKPHAHSSGK